MASAEMIETAVLTADIGKNYRICAEQEERKLNVGEHLALVANTAMALHNFKEWIKDQETINALH